MDPFFTIKILKYTSHIKYSYFFLNKCIYLFKKCWFPIFSLSFLRSPLFLCSMYKKRRKYNVTILSMNRSTTPSSSPDSQVPSKIF